jgi:hypothetical protein
MSNDSRVRNWEKEKSAVAVGRPGEEKAQVQYVPTYPSGWMGGRTGGAAQREQEPGPLPRC